MLPSEFLCLSLSASFLNDRNGNSRSVGLRTSADRHGITGRATNRSDQLRNRLTEPDLDARQRVEESGQERSAGPERRPGRMFRKAVSGLAQATRNDRGGRNQVSDVLR